MSEPKIPINWGGVKTRRDVITLVNEAYDAGYAKGVQDGWVKHKAAMDGSHDGAPAQVWVSVSEKIRESDEAILFLIDEEDHWLPKSQLKDIETGDNGDPKRVLIPQWLAERRGLT